MTHLTAIPANDVAVFGLNAYLLDFYTHGQATALSSANGIRRGDVWYALEDFVLSLKTIRGAMVELLRNASPEKEKEPDEDYDNEDEDDPSHDPVESDLEQDDKGFAGKPAWVSDQDWRVHELVDEATNEFDEKFRAIFA